MYTMSSKLFGKLSSGIMIIFLTVIPIMCAFSQDSNNSESIVALKQLSIEELMNLEVTSVSRRSEKLSKTASSIQVITKEEILKYGATRLPEALRLASNLGIVQRDASQWSISARGFNSSTSNKLLVMIDGRTVYSPLFSGVFWDIQDVLLEDVDRIEVISGPGGTQWGPNAVNGVINIITRNAKDTHGLYLDGGVGSELREFAGLRYGGKLNPFIDYRVYGKYSKRDNSINANEEAVTDDWELGQGGGVISWVPSTKSTITLQGDYYNSKMLQRNNPDGNTRTKGGNFLARWRYEFSGRSNMELQAYYDKVHRSSTASYDDHINTYDIDFRHHFSVGTSHQIVWGGGFRQVEDNFMPGGITFVPQEIKLPLFNIFLQDEFTIIRDKLKLIGGTKLSHNYYTGYENQPSVRMNYSLPTSEQELWAAISRGVRTPSRVDRDLIITGIFNGGPDFRSETVDAYEIGYRIRPARKIYVSLATYFNKYDHIRSVEQVNPPAPVPQKIGNGFEAEGYGAELTANYDVLETWNLRLGYTETRIEVSSKPGSTDSTGGANETPDPQHYLTVQSSVQLSRDILFTQSFRYVSEISAYGVPDYSELDCRLQWVVSPHLELSVAGQNLLHKNHAEFGNINTRSLVQRNLYFKVVCRL